MSWLEVGGLVVLVVGGFIAAAAAIGWVAYWLQKQMGGR